MSLNLEVKKVYWQRKHRFDELITSKKTEVDYSFIPYIDIINDLNKNVKL